MPAFVSEDSSLSLAGVVERNFNRNPFQSWVASTQNGQSLTLTTTQRDETPLFADY